MVISDVNLLCLNQVKASTIISNSNIKITCYDRNNLVNEIIYADRYIDIQQKKGIWYYFEPVARFNGDYGHEFFDLSVESDGFKIVCNDEQIKLFLISCIRQLLFCSPLGVCYFFVDLEGYDTMNRSCDYKMFCELLKRNQLLFNTVYVIDM